MVNDVTLTLNMTSKKRPVVLRICTLRLKLWLTFTVPSCSFLLGQTKETGHISRDIVKIIGVRSGMCIVLVI